jgi:hypothetical protein
VAQQETQRIPRELCEIFMKKVATKLVQKLKLLMDFQKHTHNTLCRVHASIQRNTYKIIDFLYRNDLITMQDYRYLMFEEDQDLKYAAAHMVNYFKELQDKGYFPFPLNFKNMLKSQFSLPFVNLFEGNFTSIFSNLVFD